MSSDYAIMIGIVSVFMLIPLLLLFAWDKWLDTTWARLARPITLREVFRDWVAYVLVFVTLSLVIQRLLCLACSYCEPC